MFSKIYLIEDFLLSFILSAFYITRFFVRELFSPSTETCSAFSQFQYQKFLKTFSAKLLSSNVLCTHIDGKCKSSMYTWDDDKS